MFKKVKFPMFLFNSNESGRVVRNLTVSVSATHKKRSLFDEQQPRYIAVLITILVALLHLAIAWWILMPTENTKKPELVIIEVSMVAAPSQKAEVTPPAPPKPAPPKPEPPKKEPTKKPVLKKTPVIPKQVTLPKPPDLPQPAISTPVPAVVSVPQPVSRPTPAAAVNSEPRISTGVVPLERVPPKYPMRAANRHIEGWVKVEFTITTSGDVKNAEVVEAEPVDVFDDAALEAIEQWKFKEKIVNGVAVEQRAVQTLQFKLTR